MRCQMRALHDSFLSASMSTSASVSASAVSASAVSASAVSASAGLLNSTSPIQTHVYKRLWQILI